MFRRVYRDNGDSITGKRFCDLVFPGQCLFSISESDCVIHQPGTAPVCISGCLVTEWQCQKRMAGLPRILQNLKLPAGGIPTNGIPTDGVIKNVLLPPKSLIGNNKGETMLRYDLFDGTKMRRTKWFCKTTEDYFP